MRDKLLDIYASLFAKKAFYKWNRFLYHASVKGLGVLNYKNDQDSGEEGFLHSYLKPLDKPLVLDIGANEGRYCQLLSEANPQSQIYCFEPHPSTFKKLEQASRAFGDRITLVNKGVGEKKSTLELFDYMDNDGSSHASLYKEVIESIHQKKAVSHSVEVIDLKSFLAEQKIEKVDLLKIDTEGNELNVLKGLGNELLNSSIKAIHFEFNEMNIISKTSFKDFFELLNAFTLYRLLPGGAMLPIESYSPIDCEIYAYQNIIALRKS